MYNSETPKAVQTWHWTDGANASWLGWLQVNADGQLEIMVEDDHYSGVLGIEHGRELAARLLGVPAEAKPTSEDSEEYYIVELLDQVNEGREVWIQEDPDSLTLEQARRVGIEVRFLAHMRQSRVVRVRRQVVETFGVVVTRGPGAATAPNPERQVRGVTPNLRQTGNYEGHEGCPRIINNHCMCGWML